MRFLLCACELVPWRAAFLAALAFAFLAAAGAADFAFEDLVAAIASEDGEDDDDDEGRQKWALNSPSIRVSRRKVKVPTPLGDIRSSQSV